MSEIITVKQVFPPGAGKKQASVIDTNDKRWGIKKEEMNNYREGCSYEITRSSENEYRGTTYYTVEGMVPVGGQKTTAAPPSIPRMHDAVPQRAAPFNDDQRRMDIFVSVMINNSEFDPAVTPEDELVDICNRFKRVFTRVYGPKPAKPDPISSTRNADMNDEIPF
jgi:hypothetical protein